MRVEASKVITSSVNTLNFVTSMPLTHFFDNNNVTFDL